MAVDPRDAYQRQIYMNVPKARPVPEMSFEENRMHAYIKAYQTTAKPPQPTPQEPFDIAERARLGLLPLFEPYSEIAGIATPLDQQTLKSLHTTGNVLESRSADLTTIPEVQVFAQTSFVGDNGVVQHLQSISTQPLYSAFSFEELRFRAYWIGKKVVPEAVPAAVPAPVDPRENLQSISCQPAYMKHSFEELRLAHVRTGHELTSEQIVQNRVL